jgi:hypothetical protein
MRIKIRQYIILRSFFYLQINIYVHFSEFLTDWLRVNDTKRTKLHGIDLNLISIKNDTLIINSGVTIDTLNIENINGINIRNFLKDVFIKGENQIIRGKLLGKAIKILCNFR